MWILNGMQWCCLVICFVLFCLFFVFVFVLFCFVLFCFVLFCFVLFCFFLSHWPSTEVLTVPWGDLQMKMTGSLNLHKLFLFLSSAM